MIGTDADDLAASCARASCPASRRSRSAGCTRAATWTSPSASRACSASRTAARRCCASTTCPSGGQRLDADDGRGARRPAPARPGRHQGLVLRHRGRAQPPLPRPRHGPARASAAPGSRRWRPTTRALLRPRPCSGPWTRSGSSARTWSATRWAAAWRSRSACARPERVGALALLCPAVAFVKRDWHPLVRLLRPELGLLPALARPRRGSRAVLVAVRRPRPGRPDASPTSSSTSSSASTARRRPARVPGRGAQHLPREAVRPRRLLPAPGRARAAGAVRLVLARQADPARLPAPRRAWLPAAEQIVLEGCGHVPRSSARSAPTGCSSASSPASTRSAARARPARRREHRRPTQRARLRTEAARTSGCGAGRGRGRGSAPSGMLGSVLGARQAARGAGSRAADLDERDPDYIRENLPRLWLLASLYFRGEVRGLGNMPEDGPVLLVGNHSGGNLTPDTIVFTLAFCAYFGVERALLPARAQPRAVAARARPSCASTARWRPRRRTPARRWRPARRCSSTRAATTRSTGPAGTATGSTSTAARASSGWRSSRTSRSCPWSSIGGQETALFLSRGESLAQVLGLDRLFRLKVLPISLALPWGLNVGDMLGHIPLPAKITVEALPPIYLREEFGPDPDVDEVYDHVLRLMQDTLDALAAERRLPVLGDEGRRVDHDHRAARARVGRGRRPDALPALHVRRHALGGRGRPRRPGSAPATGCCCGSGRPRSAA